ncbi:MAG: hypothetical protein HY890_05600 [Deltaproteobacteria bacterium]|nr:hypothetical protein [Deltaproteobacteria bacterium]
MEMGRGNKYLAAKANETAAAIARAYGMDFQTARLIALKLWLEARWGILKIIGRYGAENWQRLPLKDKAGVCSAVIKALLDKKRLAAFMDGGRRHIV